MKMKKAINKAVVLLFVLASVLMLAFAANAEGTEVFGNFGKNAVWTYDENTKTLTISGEGEMTDLPNNANPFSSINTSDVEKIVFEGGITYISKYSFSTVYAKEIILPKTLEKIGDSAFCNAKITEIQLPEGLKEIGASAFADCRLLGKIVLPDGLEKIGSSAFMNSALSEIIIPDSVKEVGSNVFCGCRNLEKVKLSESLTTLSSSVFRSCTSLKNITIPDSVTSIGPYEFESCTSLESVNLGKNITKIDSLAFSNCQELRFIELPGSIKEIGVLAFQDCKKLEIKQNAPVDNIGNGAFKNCRSLKSFALSEKCETIYLNTFRDCQSLESIVLPESLKKIGEYAFYNCYSLKRADIPSGVLEIGTGAFSLCKSLTELVFPDGDKIEFSVNGCYSLKYVRIPTGTKRVSLYDCASLESVTLPEGVTEVNYYGCESLKEIYIPETVTKISPGTFKNCRSLKEIIIPDHVTSVDGKELFMGCERLERAVLPICVTEASQNMFSGCSSLKEVVFKSEIVDTVYGEAFADCTSLYNLPVTSKTSIGLATAFKNTGWYNSQPEGVVYYGKIAMGYKGTMPENTTLTFKSDCNTIAGFAFENRKEIKKVIIHEGIKTINNSAFKGCTNLSEITVPDTALRLGSDVFESTAWYSAQKSGNVYLGKVLYKYKGSKREDFSVSVKSGTKTIAGSAFYNLSSFWFDADLPASVEYIGPRAFYEPDAFIVDVTIRNSDCEIDSALSIKAYYYDLTFITSYGGGKVYEFASKNKYYYTAILCNHASYAVIQSVSPDCDTAGSQTRHCLSCYKTFTVTLEPTGHRFEIVQTVMATCVQHGYIKHKCTNCGETQTEIITAKGHKFAEKIIRPTCTEGGCKVRVCAVCAEEERYNFTESLGHIEAPSIPVEATCLAEGKEAGVFCKRCGETLKEGKSTPRTDHSFGQWSVKRSVQTENMETEERKCLVCGLTETQTSVVCTAHTYKKTVTKATLEKDGKVTEVCTLCGEEKVQKIAKVSSLTLSKTSYIYDAKEKKPTITVMDTDGKKLISGKDYTAQYLNNKNCGIGSVKVTFIGNYSGTKSITFKILPGQVTGLKVSTFATTSLKLSWTKVSGAKYYKVEQSTDGKTWKTITTTDKTSYTISKLSAGTKYQYRVTALDSTKKIAGKTSAVLKTGTKTVAPVVTLKSSKSKTAVVSWKKVNGANKYIVYKSTDGTKWTKVTTTTKLTYTLTKLTGGKKIYVKVVAVNAYGKESATSAVKNVTVKK